MNVLNDLKLKEDIVPIFDNTLCVYSQQKLIDILTIRPVSDEELLNRQNIIKGFMEHHTKLESFNYSKYDFNEFYLYVLGLVKYDNLLKNKWFLASKGKANHELKSRIVQFVQWIHRIQLHYISRMKLSQFPVEFADKLDSFYAFLQSFNAAHYDLLFQNNKLKNSDYAQLLKRISIANKKKELALFFDFFFAYEAYVSIANRSLKLELNFPIIVSHGIKFKDLFHPLLKNPVKSSFESKSNVLLITGANMSGKSTFIKAFALCVYLASIGLPVPAQYAELPRFKHIAVSINTSDDIKNGYSHFMTEINNLKHVVETAQNSSVFAVFDELFKGTNIEDALEISEATINGLIQFKQSFFIISTHLQQLKNILVVENNEVDCYYLSAEITEGSPRFLYELRAGWSDLKIGKYLFQKEGLLHLLSGNVKF